MDHVAGLDGLGYEDRSTETLTLVLTDLLADDELRTLLADVLNNSGSSIRELLKPFGLSGRADEIVEKLDRAELIQFLLLAPSPLLMKRIDKLIVLGSRAENQSPALRVDPGEVRRLKTNRGLSFGMFGTYPEISQYGVRFTSNDFSLGPMRLKRLVDALYQMSDHAEIDELEWQLREVEGDDPAEQLEEFVRSAGPDTVVARLILARRTNQIMACEQLGLDYDDFANDQDFVEAILWKLGFYSQDVVDPYREFWDHHGRLKRYAQTAGVGARVDAVELRSRAVNYFVELERVLDDTLSFATWALVNDHLAAERPFAYEPSVERPRSFDRLSSFEGSRSSDGNEEVRPLGDSNTLYPLIHGFSVLADLLQSLTVQPEAQQRDIESYPSYAEHTELKAFPFRHQVPFLDLLPKSQSRILASLRDVHQTLAQADVAMVRNDYMHYRASMTDLPRLDASLEAAERAVLRLEADGLCRSPFKLTGDTGDGWGRRVYTLRNSKGRDIAFARPTAVDWNRLPTLRGLQYVMPAAVFARPNEMLRFRPEFTTPYAEYWKDYPKPRRNRGSMSATAADQGQDVGIK
jgi:hypothetical protein